MVASAFCHGLREPTCLVPGETFAGECASSDLCIHGLNAWLHKRMESQRAALKEVLEEQEQRFRSDFLEYCKRYFESTGRLKKIELESSLDLAQWTKPRPDPPCVDLEMGCRGSMSPEQCILPGEAEVIQQPDTPKHSMGGKLHPIVVSFDDRTSMVEPVPPVSPRSSNSQKPVVFIDIMNVPSFLHANMRTFATLESFNRLSYYNRAKEVLRSPMFELLCIVIICLNAVVLALEQQYYGIGTGHSLGFQSYTNSIRENWSSAPTIFNILDKAFVSIFMMELLLRLLGDGWAWFRSLWTYLDVAVMSVAIASWVLDVMNPSFVRLARFAKLIRIMRVMRSNRLVESLKLLSASIQASCSTLCVALFVLCVIHIVAAMAITQLVEPFVNDPTQSTEVRKEVFAYYGTFYRSVITMFEITFANWAPTCRLLIDNVNEWYAVFFLFYRCFVGFAILSVIQAVFIQQTMKSAQLDDDFVVQEKNRERESYAGKLAKIFRRLDTSGDGLVTWDEFESLLSDSRMQLLLQSLDVDVQDVEVLFQMIADDEGRISSDEFIAGIQRIKGPAQAFDMVTLLGIARRVETKVSGGKSRSFTVFPSSSHGNLPTIDENSHP
jgi:voltage-gated sodium channel